MSYATAADLLARFSAEEIAQRVDRSVGARLVSADLLAAAVAGESLAAWSEAERAAVASAQALIAQALADADSTIDGYLATRYAVPMASPPAAVKRLACDMARYFLHDDQASETVQKRYDAALTFFRDVAAGKVSLGDPAEAPAATGGNVEMTSAPAVWRRSASADFI